MARTPRGRPAAGLPLQYFAKLIELQAMDMPLPHDGVNARLGVSPIHGIGVFAILPIDAGAYLFGPETGEIQPIPITIVDSLPAQSRRLYTDFCVPIEGSYFAPSSFNQITIAWYLNHDESPNVACTREHGFTALRAIAPGEELTLDYRTFHPGPLPWQI